MNEKEIDKLIEEAVNEEYFKNLNDLLEKSDYKGSETVFDNFIKTIKFDNFASKMEIITKLIDDMINRRVVEFEPSDNGELLINLSKSINSFNENFTFDDEKSKDPNVEKEIILIYHITQTIYYELQLDNAYEMSKMNEKDIKDINLLLDKFIGKYTDYESYNTHIDWRGINVKTLQ